MNKTKLARRTALAAKIRDRYNPPYRVMILDWSAQPMVMSRADTRDGARKIKRDIADRNTLGEVWIERRTDAGTYERIR